MDTIAFIEALSAVMKKEELHSVKVSNSEFGDVEVQRQCTCLLASRSGLEPDQREHPLAGSKEPFTKVVETDVASARQSKLYISSPLVGTFYPSLSPGLPPCVKVGDLVSEESVVCIVEAMKLFNEIESEISGKIVKVLVEDNSPIEYDQPLFIVEPS